MRTWQTRRGGVSEVGWSETHTQAPLNKARGADTSRRHTHTVEEASRFSVGFVPSRRNQSRPVDPLFTRPRRAFRHLCLHCVLDSASCENSPSFQFHQLPSPGAPRPRAPGSAAAIVDDGVTCVGVVCDASRTGVDGGRRRRLHLQRGRRQLAGRASAVARLLPLSLAMRRARWGGGGARPEGATPPTYERGATEGRGPHSPPPPVSARWTGA